MVDKWGKFTFEFFRNEYISSSGAKSGVQLITAYTLFEEHEDDTPPSWSSIVFNFNHLGREELRNMGIPEPYVKGYSYATYVVDQKYFLQHITRKLQGMGVRFEQRRIDSLSEPSLSNYDLIINCTGMGAYDLLNDKEMYPVRGQVLRVRAPWMKNVWFFGKTYIIPNLDNVVVGFTAQKGNWDTKVNIEDTKNILDNCAKVFPSIKEAAIDNAWVGLRPGRAPLRLESEVITNAQDKQVQVTHCYGHGGSGITLCLGCAQDVLENHVAPWLAAYESSKGLRSRL
ncbi:FAD-binding oxidoreductase [archaeon]|nr:MAG: FAD-binding oxidoreductase [archaeon]